MRDIRPDLEERLAALGARRQAAERQLAEIDQQEAALRALLTEEIARWERVQPSLSFAERRTDGVLRESNKGSTPLAQFLVTVLGDHKAHPLGELVDLAAKAQLDFGAKNPGRSIHFALTGMAKNGWVKRTPEGTWIWTKPDREELKRETMTTL